jgi:hypothetical protein
LLFKEKSKRIFPPIGARAVVLKRNISKKQKQKAKKKIDRLFANSKCSKPRLCALFKIQDKPGKPRKTNLRAFVAKPPQPPKTGKTPKPFKKLRLVKNTKPVTYKKD